MHFFAIISLIRLTSHHSRVSLKFALYFCRFFFEAFYFYLLLIPEHSWACLFTFFSSFFFFHVFEYLIALRWLFGIYWDGTRVAGIYTINNRSVTIFSRIFLFSILFSHLLFLVAQRS